MESLRILHILRAPTGGLFRHVMDLVTAQTARGHKAGVVITSLITDDRSRELLRQLEPLLALGLTFIPTGRTLNLSDAFVAWRVMRLIRNLNPDIVHGHGAKGGAFARLAAGYRGVVSAYTPHGGSLLLPKNEISTRFYLAIERLLMQSCNLYIFESLYSSQLYLQRVGQPRAITKVIHNGLAEQEFELPRVVATATDLIFLGELRPVKGVAIFLDAILQLRRRGVSVTATIVGSGPSRASLERYSRELGLSDVVTFRGTMNSRDAMTLGRIMVVPSFAESLPYVVLEAAAAAKPLIATRVGGVPEIFGPLLDDLVSPGNADELASAIYDKMTNPVTASDKAMRLRAYVHTSFRIDIMADSIMAAYQDAIAVRRER